MSDQKFDMSSWVDTYRDTFASALRAQKEGLKAMERFARFNYAVAGDYLEAGIAQAQAAVDAKSPAEFLSKQADLGTQLSDKLRARSEEFSSLAEQVKDTAASFATEATNHVKSTANKLAA